MSKVIPSLLVLTSLLIVLSAASQSASDGALAVYHFDEGSGDHVSDATNNHNDGLVIGGATWTEGIHGGALLFNGLNRVQITSGRTLDRQSAVSISAWIRGSASHFRVGAFAPHFRSPHF